MLHNRLSALSRKFFLPSLGSLSPYTSLSPDIPSPSMGTFLLHSVKSTFEPRDLLEHNSRDDLCRISSKTRAGEETQPQPCTSSTSFCHTPGLAEVDTFWNYSLELATMGSGYLENSNMTALTSGLSRYPRTPTNQARELCSREF